MLFARLRPSVGAMIFPVEPLSVKRYALVHLAGKLRCGTRAALRSRQFRRNGVKGWFPSSRSGPTCRMEGSASLVAMAM